jgi:putative ABC transport system substrate-binding protein
MERRRFLGVLCATAAASPLATLAQRPTMPFVGFLNTGSPNERTHLVEAFRQGLKEAGYIDGKDVAIEYRWAEGHYERLPSLASELVRRQVAVIAATGGSEPGVAAKAATSTIPIVFTGGGDPVQLGLVASLSRPGGNATGITNVGGSLEAKRFEILRELLPKVSTIAFLVNPNNVTAKSSVKEVRAAAAAAGKQLHVVNVAVESDFDPAFATIKRSRAGAVLVAQDALFVTRRDQLVALAGRHAIPAVYGFREFTTAGGLLSYGADIRDVHRQAGIYTGRILKGAKPADLPVLQATKFELVLNLKTAKKLGLNISRDFLARVDAVIE